MLEIAILTVFPLAMLVSAFMDMLTMTIPNKVSLLLIIGFFLLAPFVGLGWLDILQHVGVGIALMMVGMGMFYMGWIGGGDAKLFAATGLWLGFNSDLLVYVLMASIYGGGLTLLLLAYRAQPTMNWYRKFPWMMRLHDKNEGVPYGIALAIAGILIYPQTIWMHSLY